MNLSHANQNLKGHVKIGLLLLFCVLTGPGREKGPVYVTSVSGPKMYELSRAEWMDRAGGNMQLFQVISISRTVLNFKSITVTGEVYDAFDLVKEDGNSSILINRITIE